MKKIVFTLFLGFLCFGFLRIPLLSEERKMPPEPKVLNFNVEFNSEPVRAYYMLIDARTTEEKELSIITKKIPGSIFVFFHGHGQRPENGYNLTANLALKSKSGLVLVPMCDTPYGEKEEWRGDNGKDIILMEVIRYILSTFGATLPEDKAGLDLKVKIKTKESYPQNKENLIPVNLIALGYSHGAILARRMASIYYKNFVGLGQMAPAGYEDWGSGCLGASCLMLNFTGESVCISTEIFRGHACDTVDLTLGISRGLVGDTLRSCPSCLWGNFSCFKFFRGWKDIEDCTTFMDDKNFPLPFVKNVVVLFAKDDSVFEYDNVGLSNPDHLQQPEKEKFWSTYYPGAVINGANLTLKILPGQHSGPINYYPEYVQALLSGTGQLKI